MKLNNLLTESAQVMETVAQRLTETDKPTIYASVYTIAMGITSFIDWFSSSLTQIGILTGIFGVLVLARLNHKTAKLRDVETELKAAELAKAKWEAEQRSDAERTAKIKAENAQLENRRMREQLLKMGVELRRDEDER